jgi:tetratricopeptide (TPR) repeat protein
MAVLAVTGALALDVRRAFEATPGLDQVRALARAGHFEQAQASLVRYLHAHPQDDQAHLLLAELATEPSRVQPALALEHLHAIRPGSAKQAALVKFFEGKAHYQQRRYDLAEASWREALQLDPIVPEAGWALVELLDMESRTQEAHEVGMKLHEVEPNPRDRVHILLEMCRLDIEKPDPLSQVPLFEPLVKQHPENLPLAVTLGSALLRVNRSDEGLAVLQKALERHLSSALAWDAWLTGLHAAVEPERLATEFARLPQTLAGDPRFAKHEGIVAQNAREWPRAVRAYRRAFAFEPFDQGVCYRYRFVLRQAGENAEYQRVDQFYKNYQLAANQMRRPQYGDDRSDAEPVAETKHATDRRGVYYEVLEVKTLGLQPHPELYQHLADLREKLGRLDEARAWHRLVLHDFPDNALSLAALKRLE